MSGGSSRGKGKGGLRELLLCGRGLWVRKTLMNQSPVETKRDFTKECPLRGYDNRKEDWPKYRHGEDCLVQMFVEGLDGGRRFFKCPRAECSESKENCGYNAVSLAYEMQRNGEMQCSESKENYGFTRWVDPRPIYPHTEYMYYLQDRISELERKVSSGYKDDEADDSNSGAISQEELCHDLYCTCPNHKNNGPPPPPPPPPHQQWEGTVEKGQHNLLCGCCNTPGVTSLLST